MKLTEFEFANKKHFHSPDLRTWDEWMGERENGLYLIPKTRLYEIPNALLLELPDILAGYRRTDGSFNNRDYFAYLWSSDQFGSTHAVARYLNYSFVQVGGGSNDKAYGFSAILERKV